MYSEQIIGQEICVMAADKLQSLLRLNKLHCGVRHSLSYIATLVVANTVLIAVAGVILGILIVAFLLFLNLMVTTSTINGFLFSANNLKATFHFQGTIILLSNIFISILNLEKRLNVCYYD